MPLSRTIYFSENKIGPVGRDAQMAELQKVAVIRNRRHHVTGALAYDNRWFAQALEGETSPIPSFFQVNENIGANAMF